MKFKIIMFILLISFLTGCTVNVELDVSSDQINEKVVFINPIDDEHSEESIINSFKKYEPNNIDDFSKISDIDGEVSGVSYYNREQEVFNTFVKNSYTTTYNINEYNNSRTLNVFKDAKIVNGIDYIELSTDKNGLLLYNTYSDLGDVKVTINTNLEVLDSNADNVNNTSYVWHFSKGDNQKNIYIKLKKLITDDSRISVDWNDDEPMDGNLQTLYLTLVLLAIGLVVTLFASFLIKVVTS